MTPSFDEPHARGFLSAFREAALAVWGPLGLAAIAERLPAEVREATVDGLALALDWHPSRWAIAWHEAVWDGPAGGDDARFCTWVDRSIDLGFGRIKRSILALASPAQLIARAPKMWREQHSHGQLQVDLRGRGAGGGATVLLRDYPLTRNALARRALAEAYRHVASLSRRRDVRETHGALGLDALVVHLTWGGGDGGFG